MIRHHAILHFAMADDQTSEGGLHGAPNEVERPMKNARARSSGPFVRFRNVSHVGLAV